ncbi:unnamed protein product [Dovyalis caffra]|uniref:Prolactin receptor n=1 Tax=Dovyalis caffra TaxID=77055 RepID=A0AAV1S0V8_9ROSI|nr:unnamed protein product [Dovyalis caffra]
MSVSKLVGEEQGFSSDGPKKSHVKSECPDQAKDCILSDDVKASQITMMHM